MAMLPQRYADTAITLRYVADAAAAADMLSPRYAMLIADAAADYYVSSLLLLLR